MKYFQLRVDIACIHPPKTRNEWPVLGGELPLLPGMHLIPQVHPATGNPSSPVHPQAPLPPIPKEHLSSQLSPNPPSPVLQWDPNQPDPYLTPEEYARLLLLTQAE